MVLEAKNTAGKVLLIWGKWVVEKIDHNPKGRLQLLEILFPQPALKVSGQVAQELFLQIPLGCLVQKAPHP